MSGTRPSWRGMLFLALLLGALGSVHAIPPDAVPSWLTATQAYLRQDYVTAHAAFARVLQANLTPSERAQLLWQDADCLRHLDRPADAAAVLEQLIQKAPDSPYLLQGCPLLYRYYLEIGATEKADTLWRMVLPRMQQTPYLWDLLSPRLVALARIDADQLAAQAELIVEGKPDSATLTTAVYRPLFAAQRMTEAKALHERLQELFSEIDPKLAGLDGQAYDDAVTRNFIDSLISECRKAITAGDMELARYWMTTIMTTIPEYPQAAEMRALFDAKVQEMRKD